MKSRYWLFLGASVAVLLLLFSARPQLLCSSSTVYVPVPVPVNAPPVGASEGGTTTTPPPPVPNPTTPSLAKVCKVDITGSCPMGRTAAASSFDRIYRTAFWSTVETSHTRSGLGSNMFGAFDTIIHLTKFMKEHNVTTIADIPCGDLGWQNSVRSINAATAYFGGDISYNGDLMQEHFKDHHNKVFRRWDFVQCGVPHWRTSCDPTERPFEFVMTRDVMQHIPISEVQKAIARIVLDSGAKYLGVTSYNPKDGPANHRSPTARRQFCQQGRIGDGGWVGNCLQCAPFNFPTPVYAFKSHKTFPIEPDEFEIFAIDDKLKEIVRGYTSCQDDKPLQLPALLTKVTPSPTTGAVGVCRVEVVGTCASTRRSATFDDVYLKGSASEFGHTLQGNGSTMHGGFDTTLNMTLFMSRNRIDSIADLGSGDLGWQFAVQPMNLAKAYFGGDVSPSVVSTNQKHFSSHANKAFAVWDFIDCGVPKWRNSCEPTTESPFKAVMLRDVLLHTPPADAVEGLRRVVNNSGADWLVVTDFAKPKSGCPNFCSTTSTPYRPTLDCPPFNFPTPHASYGAHTTFPFTDDRLSFYQISRLKQKSDILMKCE
eukprot:Sspe_Gene.1092::Locus_370_Transcript_2_2_Confidence_0.750_Length_2270::g.1092::m.1092